MTSAASAFRQDLVSLPADPARDGAWLVVASLAEQAASLPEERCAAALREAAAIAAARIGDAEFRRRADREWPGGWTDADAVALAVIDIQEAGSLRLAASLLDTLLQLPSLPPLQRGRILALRGRVFYKMDLLDAAEDQFRQVATLARSIDSRELETRAALGLSSLAQLRGNYPELARLSKRAARLADRNGFDKLGRIAHFGLMIVAAKAGRLSDALVEGWRAYECSRGDGVDEASSLQSLGQLLLEAGDRAAAKSAFTFILRRTLPARIILPSLSGLAMATAPDRGEHSTLEWSVAEILRAREAPVPRYVVAAALLEAATALGIAGRISQADALRAEALAIATALGFHEIAYQAEALDARALAQRGSPRESSLDARAAEVARSVRALEPKRLPRHVRLAAASAS